MALIKELKGSFVGGKVSKPLQNRIDLEKFNTWLSEAKNTQIKPEGSISNRAGTVFVGVAKDVTYKLTINVNVSAMIIINGVEYTGTTASVDLPIGSTYSYSVSTEGYTTQEEDNLTLNSNTIKNIILESSATTYTFKITNEQGATISIKAGDADPVTGTGEVSVTELEGTRIEWSVTKEGYVTQGDTFALSSETVSPLPITLVEVTLARITIVSSQYGSTIKITADGQTDTYENVGWASKELQTGTEYSFEISKEGYVTEEGSGTLTTNKSVTRNLQLKTATIEDFVAGYNKVETVLTYQINKTAVYRIEIKGDGKTYIGSQARFNVNKGKGGKAVLEKTFIAGDELTVKGISKSVTINGTTYDYLTGVGVWLGAVCILVAGSGGGSCMGTASTTQYIGGSGYNGGQGTLANGLSYDGSYGNSNLENTGSCGEKIGSAYGGSGYVKSDYTSYATLTPSTNSNGSYVKIEYIG